jgi:hypothetical protein
MDKDEAYREAEKEIEQARWSGAAELDLSGSYDHKKPKLTQLPESLGQLTQLQTLNLSDNKLTTLPESLGQLTQLQTLNLSDNKLITLPESLGQLTPLQTLNLSDNKLTTLPESLGQLTQLRTLNLSDNNLTTLPESLGQLTQLQTLNLSDNKLTTLPESLGQLTQLRLLTARKLKLKAMPVAMRELKSLETLDLGDCSLNTFPDVIRPLVNCKRFVFDSTQLSSIPSWIGELRSTEELILSDNQIAELPETIGNLNRLRKLILGRNYGGNRLTDLPAALWQLKELDELELTHNPLNPELAAADKEGLHAVRRYLRAKTEAQVVLNEAKLILIGEGEVGKSALLGALRGDDWVEKRDSTHGIEIKPVKVTDPTTGTKITLNGWDFGGQRVYRPTHQLFFSSPAVYLVVWKPREGPQQGFVKDWIKLVKHREPDAKILVVATHGGPKQRQPDIDRQEIWDLFGKERVTEFFFVDSKPDANGEGSGIAKLRDAIARAAAGLPEVGRSVPKTWQEVREALKQNAAAYLPLERVLSICREHKMDEEEAQLFVTISHRLGHLIYYEHDPALRDIVVLRPDWLATAVSFILDDKETRDAHGLVTFGRLSQLWDDPKRDAEFRYPHSLHPVLLSLMERFDLSYPVSGSPLGGPEGETSLIAQLVPDVRPQDDLEREWPAAPEDGDEQQLQICRIVDAKAQSAPAEGLFYQLIVRLHKFSLGRANFDDSIHWQRGLVLDDDYNGRALLENLGNDVKITTRAAYPGAFLAVLTREVKWLVESFWEGLRCDVMVPCIEPCGRNAPGTGLYEVEKLIESKKKRRPEYPCPVCNEWQDIDCLLQNAPVARRSSLEVLFGEGFEKVLSKLDGVRGQLMQQDRLADARFQVLDQNDKRIMSQVDDAFRELMRALIDEAKEGPRLFSFEPIDPGFFDRPKWMSTKFRLTLWCEHSRRPLWFYSNGRDAGVYTIDLPREWLVKAAPFLKVLSSTLGLLLPVVAATAKIALPETSYKGIEAQLALGKATAEALLKGSEGIGGWLVKDDKLELPEGTPTRAAGGVLRQLHAWLKEKDPSFGGLMRVQNKRQEFLWVHPLFEKEY